MSTSGVGSTFAATAPTTSGTESGGDNTVVIVTLVVIFVVLVIAAIGLRIWWYRRKHGHYPSLRCKRSQQKPSNLRPFGDKTVAARWHINNNNDPNMSRQTIASHHADYRLPTPVSDKKVVTVTETVTKDKSPTHKTSQVIATENVRESPGRKSIEITTRGKGRRSSRESRRKSKDSQKLPSDIGLYQDRTLPATLMMTNESKIQMFAKENTNLKRSNSATLRKPLNTTLQSEQRRPYSVNIEVYNDFSGDQALDKYPEERSTRHLSAISSQLSSKPSNTSDYVSDVEGCEGKGWRKRKNASRLRMADRRKRVSDCDSAFHECSVIENEDIVEMYESEIGEAMEALRQDMRSSAALRLPKLPFDERTESQQNTMRSEVLASVLHQQESDDSTFENQQSSDTESMADSCTTRRSSKSKRFMRQYDSDGGARLSSRRIKTKSKRRHKGHRASSDGYASEPGFVTSRAPSKRRTRRLNLDSYPDSELDKPRETVGDCSSDDKSEVFLSSVEAKPKVKKPQNAARKKNIKYKTTSLTSPTGSGTVIEMPIYSQATWAGPGTTISTKKTPTRRVAAKPRHRSEGAVLNDQNRPQSARTHSKHKRAGRKLSIGGGGRYICEYGTLPVDLSKLPPDLIAKLGGRPDRLLEPLDRLNFEKLCRPLPTVGEVEAKLSARRLVAEKLCLPPGHRDREILSQTYELESTGLVMTDL